MARTIVVLEGDQTGQELLEAGTSEYAERTVPEGLRRAAFER